MWMQRAGRRVPHPQTGPPTLPGTDALTSDPDCYLPTLLPPSCSPPYTGQPASGYASATAGNTATATCSPGIIGSIVAPYWGCGGVFNSTTIYEKLTAWCVNAPNCSVLATVDFIDNGDPW